MRYRPTSLSAAARRGVVLPAVLIVVVVLTLAAYEYSELVTAEYRAADAYTRSAQARALAESGVGYAAALLSNPENVTNVLNGNVLNNEPSFRNIQVTNDESARRLGRFTIVAPPDPEQAGDGTGGLRYGVTDEAGKINLNGLMKLDSSGQVAHDMLMKLPNMTEEVANSILDWLDPDETPRSGGAENETYSAQTPPYRCKNGPLNSLEELLFVNGVTPQLLLGNDRNRNGILDPDEDDGAGALDRGWAAYLTVYSREQNLDGENQPKLYINDQDLETLNSKLQTLLGPDLANYIIAYRLFGGTATTGGSSGRSSGSSRTSRSTQSSAQQQIASARQSRSRRPQSIASLFDLVNSTVSIPGQRQSDPAITLPSPLNDPGVLRQLLPTVLDKLTTQRDTELPPRVNINTAPQAVLAALPGLSETDVQNILSHRPSPTAQETPDPIFQSPAWLITQANFQPSTLKTLERYVTTRSQVYRLQSVGHFDDGGPTARVEAVIDMNAGRPRVIYWRDLTELGRGLNLTSD